jgi:hypothetical protein
MSKTLKPDQIAPKSGQYGMVGPRGGDKRGGRSYGGLMGAKRLRQLS